jgi:threonylcarbamoyladenosine tRNA methylthiotransferase MtaB
MIDIQQPRVGFCTLGCKLNFSESSTIARAFEQAGYIRVDANAPAEVYVINTCSVTEHADKKCRNLIRRLVRNNPRALIAVTGCYAQLKPREVADIEGVDIVVGNNDKDRIVELISRLSVKQKGIIYGCNADGLTDYFSAYSTGDRTRSFLKVQDGCSYKCSYCTIPIARGESRNAPITHLVEQARRIAEYGSREIVITGVNTGDFGHTTNERFADLIRALDGVDGIDRYRISSIEPNLLTDEIIDICANSSKFMPHFHIPLQSGSDKVLAMMRRRYNTRKFRDRIDAVRRAMPDTFFGIDVIVGFPGETEELFRQTYEFLDSIEPTFLHVFPFSCRPGTDAINLPDKVLPQVAEQRVSVLTELSGVHHRKFCEKFIGQSRNVLFETSRPNNKMVGYTDNYIRVEVPLRLDMLNRIVPVKLVEILDDEFVRGEL